MLVYVKWDGFEYFQPLFIIFLSFFSIFDRFEIAIFELKQAQKLCKMGCTILWLVKWVVQYLCM